MRDAEKTRVQILEGRPYILIGMEGVDLDFEFKYNMFSKPSEWIKDFGNGRIVVRGLNISMRIEPKAAKDGKLQLSFISDENSALSMEDYQIELTGGQTDFSKTFDYLMKEFKEYFKTEVASLLS